MNLTLKNVVINLHSKIGLRKCGLNNLRLRNLLVKNQTSRYTSTFGVFDNKEKAEEGKWIREQEKHQHDLELSSEDAKHSKDVNMHILDVGRSEILHILLDSGEPLSKQTVDKIIWSLYAEFKKILK